MLRLTLLILGSCIFSEVALASATTPSFSSLPSIRKYYGVPGLGAAILKGTGEDRLSYVEVTGKRKSLARPDLQPEDAFHLGSCTKPMTAFLVAMAVNEGRVRYSSTLKELLPDQEIHPSFAGATVEHFLVHSSGLGDESVFREIPNAALVEQIFSDQLDEREARKLLVGEILKLPPKTFPGLKTEYSNPGYMVLGHLLERIYDRSFQDLISEKIFKQLQMGSCGFGIPPKVSGHEFRGNGYGPVDEDNPKVYGPAGRVHCNLRDWTRFAGLVLDLVLERSLLLRPEISRGLIRAVNPEGFTAGGWITQGTGESRVIFFEGSNTLNRAMILIHPELSLVAAASSNAGGDQAREATLEALKFAVSLGQKK